MERGVPTVSVVGVLKARVLGKTSRKAPPFERTSRVAGFQKVEAGTHSRRRPAWSKDTKTNEAKTRTGIAEPL